MSFAKKSFSIFGTRLFLFMLGMVSSVLVTRTLGPTYRGMLEILSTVPFLLVNVGSMGIGNANLYFIGQKKYTFEKVIANSCGVVAVLGSFLFALGLLIYFVGNQTLFLNIPFFLVLFSFSIIPLLLFEKLIQYSILGKQKIYVRNKIVIFQGVSNFIGVIVFVVFFKLSILGVLLATFISYVLSCLLCFVIVSKECKIRFRLDLDMTLRAIKFGIVPFLALVVMNMIFKSDVFLIKFFLTDTELGYYGLGVALAEKLWMIPEAIGLVLFASVSGEKGEPSQAHTAQVCRVTLLFATLLAMFFYVCIPILLPLLYGKAFLPALQPFQLLLPGIALISIYLILHGDLTGRGKSIYTLRIFGCGLLANIFLNICLIPRMGVSGAALASTITYSSCSLVLALVYSRKYSIPIREILIIKRNDIFMIFDFISQKVSLLSQRR